MKKVLLLLAMVFALSLAFVAPSFALDGYVFFGVRGTGDVRIKVMVTDVTTGSTKVYQSFQNGLTTIGEPGPHYYHFTIDETGAFADEIVHYSGHPGNEGSFSVALASAYVENPDGWPWISGASTTGWKKLTVSFKIGYTIKNISTRYWVTQNP